MSFTAYGAHCMRGDPLFLTFQMKLRNYSTSGMRTYILIKFLMLIH